VRNACCCAVLLVLDACTAPGTNIVNQQSAVSNAAAIEAPIEIKAVVVSMFEHGAVTGDEPGEFQYWVERLPLNRKHDFPAGPFPLYSNANGVLGICVGGGIANATASIMALGADPRFDLSRSYWLVAGISGGDPQDSSLGSAVWAKHAVDGDLLYEIDAREIPSEWPYGMIPLGGSEPASTPQDIATGWTLDTIHFALNPTLADWAFELTRDTPLKDTKEMAAFRARYTDHPNAQRPPSVLLGDTLASSTYWHGNKLNGWANDWVKLYAGVDANFVTSNMEDTGTLTALARLGALKRADPQRVMVLRTVSNYTTPPADMPASASATLTYPNRGEPSLDAAYVVGSRVIQALLDQWERYATTPPD